MSNTINDYPNYLDLQPVRGISREKFEAWLFEQPDNRRFVFKSKLTCVLGRFLIESNSASERQISFHPDYINDQNIVPLWLGLLIKTCTEWDRMITMKKVKEAYLETNPDLRLFVNDPRYRPVAPKQLAVKKHPVWSAMEEMTYCVPKNEQQFVMTQQMAKIISSPACSL